MISSANLLDEIANRINGGRVRAAFFSTYTFGPQYFGTQPLLAFTREGADLGVIPITVVVDSRRCKGSQRGYEVVKAPANLWHPKVTLLMVAAPGTNIRWTVIAIGSGNLTRAGWEQNQEFFVVDQWGGWCIPNAIRTWFDEKWLRDCAFAHWCRRQAVRRKNADGQSALFSSIHEPLWPQLGLEAHDEFWTEAHVLAPFCDQGSDLDAEPGGHGGGFLQELVRRALPSSTLHVYLRGLDTASDTAVGVKSVFESVGESLNRSGSRLRIHVVRPVGGRLLHAKLVAWKARGSWSVVAGSPNATKAAMLDGPEVGNVEVAWQFERIGRGLPPGLFPAVKPLSLDEVAFRAPSFDDRPAWDAVESATYDPTRRRVRVAWRDGWDRAATLLRLGDRPVEESSISLQGTDDRALEVLPKRKKDQATYRSAWVPVAMPADVFDDDVAADDELTPDEWLGLLGDPYDHAGIGERTQTRTKRETERRRHSAGSSYRWNLNERVRTFEGSVAALAEAIRDAETDSAVARIAYILTRTWSAHNPAKAVSPADRAWRNWVRAGIVDALRVTDGRLVLHRRLTALEQRWGKTVDPLLLGGRDV